MAIAQVSDKSHHGVGHGPSVFACASNDATLREIDEGRGAEVCEPP